MADQTQLEDTSPDIEVAQPPSAPAKKVELDLDDAPFLQPEEKAPPPSTLEENLPDADEEAEAAARRKKKRIIIAAIGGVAILAIAAAAAWWFFFRTPPPPPPEAAKPDVIVVPSTPPPAPDQDIVRDFAPFVVPVTTPQGKTVFLICKFAAISKDEKVNQEMAHRMLALRDAIYFYLRGKDSQFLLDARNGEAIKKDLLSVFNDYLSQGKLEDIVFESYLSN